MRISKQILAWALIVISCLGLSGLVLAAVIQGPTSVPAFGTVLTSTSVNFSVTINSTTNGNNSFLLKIMNSSTIGGNYSELIAANVTNATFWNYTATMRDGIRHYWFANWTNASTDGFTSSRQIFNVDVSYYKQIFGSQGNINFSLDRGDINISGKLRVNNFTLMDSSGAEWECGINTTGQPHCLSR